MTGGKKRIVIVDDDEDLLNLMTESFKTNGFEVKTFTTGKEGLSYLTNEKNIEGLSLIILDRILPDMDGLAILKAFQERFSDKVPVLILSVLTAEKDILRGFKEGAVDYMGKPFSVSVLLHKAIALIGK